MKKIFILLLAAFQVNSQVSFNSTPKYLDKNYVKARINTVNNKFWAIQSTGRNAYEVPKGKNTHAQFANSIWIGGFDSGGQLHLSANTYRQLGTDFWPGPLDTTSITTFSLANTGVYNKLWKVDCDDIGSFFGAYLNGSIIAGTYTVPADIANYPATGIANFQKSLEPFYDVNADGNYLPSTQGDYPIIKGHQQILAIYNDRYAAHGESKGLPMGLEIHERAYAYFDPFLPDSMQAVNYSTFHYYTIYNRSSTTYSNVFIGDWSDVDLGGNYTDDFIGTDSINNFAYCYNADAFDETVLGNGTVGYGDKVPVVSHAILKTPCTTDGIDNDVDGQIDEPGEQFLMDRTTYYRNAYPTASVVMTNPDSAIHYYRYMSGKWKDGTPFTMGGNAYGGTVATNYVYPGNPATNTGWTEGSAGNVAEDARVIFSSGPFTFPAGAKMEWGFAVVFSQDSTQAVNTITQFNTRVQRDVRNVRYYDQTHQGQLCHPAITQGINESKAGEINFMVYPNPAYSKVTIRLPENIKHATVKLLDISGRIVKQNTVNEETSVIEVADLETGIYLVEVSTGNQKRSQKLVVNR